MDVDSWLGIAALCASGAISPGPSLAVVVRATFRGGRSGGVATAVGHGVGVGLYAFGAVLGFSAVVLAVPGLERLLSLAGAMFLAWLGLKSLRSTGGATAEPAMEGGRPGLREGFLTAFLNPKITVFFLALLGSFVPVQAGAGERALVAVLAAGIDTVWYVLVALVLAGTGLDRRLADHGLWIDRIMGCILLIAAVIVVVR